MSVPHDRIEWAQDNKTYSYSTQGHYWAGFKNPARVGVGASVGVGAAAAAAFPSTTMLAAFGRLHNSGAGAFGVRPTVGGYEGGKIHLPGLKSMDS